MPADLNYAYEKYDKARNILATSIGSARQRLLEAYVGSAHLAQPLRSLPGQKNYEDLATRIAAFHTTMTSAVPTGDEGSIAATIDSFTDDQVSEALNELVSIADVLQWEHHEAE